MKEWLLSVTAVGLLFIMLELLLSDGATKKYIQGVLRLLLVLAILTPLLSFFQKDYSLPDENQIGNNLVYSKITDENNRINSHIKKDTENKIEKTLKEKGIDCQAEIILDEKGVIETIAIKLQMTGINLENENIYSTDKIKEAVTDILNINEELIIIYETNKDQNG